MHECLNQICKEFETIKNFFDQPTVAKTSQVDFLFEKFMECFSNLKEEKFQYPKEFINDCKLYNENFEPICKKFEDIQIRYLMLSDFYDFVRLTKKYKRS